MSEASGEVSEKPELTGKESAKSLIISSLKAVIASSSRM